MAAKPNTFLVGIFVLAGVAIGVGAIIWLGASKFFEKSGTYVTFFDESVSGLERSAPVKFRGVNVGRVEKIEVAPDGRLVEVVLSLRPSFSVTPKTRARLQVAGITGIKFIELDLAKPSQAEETLAPRSETKYPVIPSTPSDLKEILNNIKAIFETIKKMDLDGIAKSMKTTMKSVETLVDSEHWQSILANLDVVVADMTQVAAHVDKIVSNPDIGVSVAAAKNLLVQGQMLLTDVRKQIQGMKLDARLGKTMDQIDGITRKTGELVSTADQRVKVVATDLSGLISNVDDQSSSLLRELTRTTYELEQAVENIRTLSRHLRDNPSSLIFSRRPRPRDWERESSHEKE
jgi:phospholipid/cholesterol/gamma-HCH transport system substrate-binding protein